MEVKILDCGSVNDQHRAFSSGLGFEIVKVKNSKFVTIGKKKNSIKEFVNTNEAVAKAIEALMQPLPVLRQQNNQR